MIRSNKIIVGMIVLSTLGVAHKVNAETNDNLTIEDVKHQLSDVNAKIKTREKQMSVPLLVTNLNPKNDEYLKTLKAKSRELKQDKINLETKEDAKRARQLTAISQVIKVQEQSRLEAEKEKTDKENLKKAEDAKKAEEAKQAEDAKQAEAEKAKQDDEAKTTSVEAQSNTGTATPSASPSGSVSYGANGLLNEVSSAAAQNVINLLIGIPGHSNGSSYHQSTGLDAAINNLTVEEGVYVIHRIEGAGFGQTGSGYAGYDTPESHQVFVRQQVNGRFGGSIHALLKAWGTYSYGGY